MRAIRIILVRDERKRRGSKSRYSTDLAQRGEDFHSDRRKEFWQV
jgi:hypothetical protein